MPLSVRLTPEEERQLEAAARQCACSKSELVRQGVRELCQRLLRPKGTPYELGKDLFGVGRVAEVSSDPMKRQVWDKLCDKHRRVG